MSCIALQGNHDFVAEEDDAMYEKVPERQRDPVGETSPPASVMLLCPVSDLLSHPLSRHILFFCVYY